LFAGRIYSPTPARFEFLFKKGVTMGDPLDPLAQELPDVVKAFRELHGAVTGDGALSARTKQLIIIGISVALGCEPCLQRHVPIATEMGISRGEIIEAAGVAILMGGGPAAAYATSYVLDELDG
jgi:AhpD family alkylhydroperoxidase